MEAYGLSAHVLNCYDIHEGLFTRFHQTQADSETYLEDMKLLAYDVLYGSYESYDGVNPYEPTELQLGLEPITLQSIRFHSTPEGRTYLLINGNHFTPYSIVYINGEKCATTYVNPQLLSVTEFESSEELNVCVAQVGSDSQPLSFTEPLSITILSEDSAKD